MKNHVSPRVIGLAACLVVLAALAYGFAMAGGLWSAGGAEVTIVDGDSWWTGRYSSITTGSDGLGLISYFENVDEHLRVAHCSDLACSDATITEFKEGSPGWGGWSSSIAIGSDGLGIIAHTDRVVNAGLHVTHCLNIECSSATNSILEVEGKVEGAISIAIGSDGLGLISFAKSFETALMVAHCTNIECSSATITTVDSTGGSGGPDSLAIGTDGLGLISYSAAGELRVAHCENIECSNFTLSVVDSQGDIRWYNSIAIGSDGLGLISYFDNATGDLKVAHCLDVECSSATTSILDGEGVNGPYTSIAIGSDGLGLISYYDLTNKDLKVAHCSDVECSSAVTGTLDSLTHVGEHNSITIGSDGLGLISYYDSYNRNLRVVHCEDLICTPEDQSFSPPLPTPSPTSTIPTPTATPTPTPFPLFEGTISTVDNQGFTGWFTSIAIGADGLGLISYHQESPRALRVAHCLDITCSSATTFTLDTGGIVGEWTSVAIGSDGLGLISYLDRPNGGIPGPGNLMVAHCRNVECSTANTYVVDSEGWNGQFTSIAIGTDGLGLISYYDFTDVAPGSFYFPRADLKVAHCSNIECSDSAITTLDSEGEVGTSTSIAIGSDGLGLISYVDHTNQALKVAHCSNVACTSATLSTLDNGVAANAPATAIVIGADGLGLISYYDWDNRDLKVAHCSNVECTSATISTLDSEGEVGWSNSISIGADGLGLISYFDGLNSDIKMAHCSNVECTSANVYRIEGDSNSGWYSSITVGLDGMGIIGYRDLNTGSDFHDEFLKVAHCPNLMCASVYPGGSPTLSVSNIAVNENGGNATLSISLDPTSVSDVTVDYATSDWTATAGSEYVETSGTATIPGGATSATIDVPIIDNIAGELNKAFLVGLSNPSPNASVSQTSGSASVMIVDNEAAPLPMPVPSLPLWGLIVMGGLMTTLLLWSLRKRTTAT